MAILKLKLWILIGAGLAPIRGGGKEREKTLKGWERGTEREIERKREREKERKRGSLPYFDR